MPKEQVTSQGMTPLPSEVRKYGRIMRQVWRDEHTAIYEYFGGYEVIVIKKMPETEAFGKQYPPREVYPSEEDWGSLAITRPATDSLEYLKERANELLEANPAFRRDSEGRVISSGGIKVAGRPQTTKVAAL